MNHENNDKHYAAQSQADLINWYATIAGSHVLSLENQMLAGGLEKLFGYHLVSLGPVHLDDAGQASPIAHRININRYNLGDRKPGLMGRLDDLALQNDSIDVLVMPHVLEYSNDPHAILREAKRVVLANGHVVIMGFNPISCFGICRLAMGLLGKMPWRGHYYHPARLNDWLKLLGFDIVRMEYAAFTPPVQHQPTLGYLSFMEKLAGTFLAPVGGVYMIVARKLVVTPNVMKPKWASHASIIKSRAAEPSSRVVNQRSQNRRSCSND